jgi:hypothetical protein
MMTGVDGTQRDFDEGTQTSHVSTGRLPPAELVRTLVAEAHGRYKSSAEGTNSQAYPPSFHWITSSAVASSVSGMVRARALAVLRLMTRSIFVICCTGKSAGFSPLRMRPA